MSREKRKECHPNNDWQQKKYNGRNIEEKRERERKSKKYKYTKTKTHKKLDSRANQRSLELLFLLRRKKKLLDE
jgi:hypothetical protein